MLHNYRLIITKLLSWWCHPFLAIMKSEKWKKNKQGHFGTFQTFILLCRQSAKTKQKKIGFGIILPNSFLEPAWPLNGGWRPATVAAEVENYKTLLKNFCSCPFVMFRFFLLPQNLKVFIMDLFFTFFFFSLHDWNESLSSLIVYIYIDCDLGSG